MANPNKGYTQRKHLHVSSAKPTFNKYITAFAEWAKGCRTSCKECGKELADPETAPGRVPFGGGGGSAQRIR